MLLEIFLVLAFVALLIVPRAPMITGMVSVFTFHILLISNSKSLYVLFFSLCFRQMFRSHGTDMSISWHVLVFVFFTTISGLLALIFRSVIIGQSHMMVIWSLLTIFAGSC